LYGCTNLKRGKVRPTIWQQLGNKVDSLTKVCVQESNQTFYGLPQGKGNYLILRPNTSIKLTEWREILETNISYDDFVATYKPHISQEIKSLPIVKTESIEIIYGKKVKRGLFSLPTFEKQSKTGRWYINKRDSDSSEITLLYITDECKQWPIPQKYNSLISYSICLLAGSSPVFSVEEAPLFRIYEPDPLTTSHREALIQEIECLLELNFPLRYSFFRRHGIPSELLERYKPITAQIKNNPKLRKQLAPLMAKAVKEAIINNNSNIFLENLIEETYTSKAALELTRSRRVRRAWCMDSELYEHLDKITSLAAKEQEVGLFIKSHLLLLDLSPRIHADFILSNYVSPKHKLENIRVNVPYLAISTALKTVNPLDSIPIEDSYTFPRIIARGNQQQQFEEDVLGILQAPQLDPYNKLQVLILYYNYLSRIKDPKETNQKTIRLKARLAQSAPYLSNAYGFVLNDIAF